MTVPLLSVDRVSKRFGGLYAVRDLNIAVQRGEIVGLIGPNGAGKTTAVSLITGFVRPDEGAITFDGVDVTGRMPHRLATLGMVRTFQHTASYPSASVLENAIRGAFLVGYRGALASLVRTRAARVAAREASEYALSLLQDLDLLRFADRPAGSIPYGHQKVLGLVHALASRPRLLLLDEPAAGLNQDEVDHVRAILEKINQSGISVLVIDHNVRFISGMCKRLIVMYQGGVLAQGPAADVIKLPAVIEAYLGGMREPA